MQINILEFQQSCVLETRMGWITQSREYFQSQFLCMSTKASEGVREDQSTMGGGIEDWNLIENRIEDRKMGIFKPTLRPSTLATRWNMVDLTSVNGLEIMTFF